jgi:hypothetical protein
MTKTTQPPVTEAMIEALEPFMRVARYFDYFVPEAMPDLCFPRERSAGADLDGFPQFELQAQDFAHLAKCAKALAAAPNGEG